MNPKILLVEDEADLGHVVRQYLELMDFDVDLSPDAPDALAKVKGSATAYQLLLIDVSLPGMDGFELARQLEQGGNRTPFLFLTARSERADRLKGLKLGADDYITKPFDIDELVLRMENILRRQAPAVQEEQVIVAGDIRLYPDRLKLVNGLGEETILTPKEAGLLAYLVANRNRVLKREQILSELWEETDYFTGRSLDVFISRLRKYLGGSNRVSISNVYGTGFVFEVKEEV